MSETPEEDYRSEFEAPPYTILSRERVGAQIITTAILDGELCEFVIDASAYDAARNSPIVNPESRELRDQLEAIESAMVWGDDAELD